MQSNMTHPDDWRRHRDREFNRVMDEYRIPPRRAQVARLICWGYTDKGIARPLGISRNAVANHCRALFRKFCVNDRESLAKRIRREMGDCPPERRELMHTPCVLFGLEVTP